MMIYNLQRHSYSDDQHERFGNIGLLITILFSHLVVFFYIKPSKFISLKISLCDLNIMNMAKGMIMSRAKFLCSVYEKKNHKLT